MLFYLFIWMVHDFNYFNAVELEDRDKRWVWMSLGNLVLNAMITCLDFCMVRAIFQCWFPSNCLCVVYKYLFYLGCTFTSTTCWDILILYHHLFEENFISCSIRRFMFSYLHNIYNHTFYSFAGYSNKHAAMLLPSEKSYVWVSFLLVGHVFNKFSA